MKQSLVQQQAMQQVMTQQLTQAIQLLQYPTMELLEYVQHLSLENPFIDVACTPSDLIRQSPIRSERLVERPKVKRSFHDDVHEQISFLSVSAPLRKTLHYLVADLDESGYFTRSREQLIAHYELADAAIATIQSLEPAGIGAFSLAHCLTLQAKRRSAPPYTMEILEQHVERLAERKWKEIAKQLKISVADVQMVFDFVQTLTPKPGYANDDGTDATYIYPEAIVRQVDGEWQVKFMDDDVTLFTVDEQYEQLMQQQPEAQSFLQEKWRECQWLQKAIEQRKMTFRKVVVELVVQQREFFEFGQKKLKPLTLKDVAEAIGVHESTVSRTVKDKYIYTPHGLMELKQLFQAATNDESTAGSTVKQQIKQLIDEENRLKPLSDQQLVEQLATHYSIQLSRRTVTKYRESMGIASSTKRKRFE